MVVPPDRLFVCEGVVCAPDLVNFEPRMTFSVCVAVALLLDGVINGALLGLRCKLGELKLRVGVGVVVAGDGAGSVVVGGDDEGLAVNGGGLHL